MVTLKVVRTEWTVVIFVEWYYDYNIKTGRWPSWLVKVFRSWCLDGPRSFGCSVGLVYI